jgi:transposase
MMSGHFWLTDEQMERLRPFFPKSRGKPRVDDRRVLSGIIYIKKNGLQWKDAPAVYGPPKTLYNRFVRWSRMGVFAMVEVSATGMDGARYATDPLERHGVAVMAGKSFGTTLASWVRLALTVDDDAYDNAIDRIIAHAPAHDGAAASR